MLAVSGALVVNPGVRTTGTLWVAIAHVIVNESHAESPRNAEGLVGITTGKCPGCGNVPAFGVNMQGVDIKGQDGRSWLGVMYVCPNLTCQTILGVGIDPIALKTDTINGVVKKLRGKL